MSGRRAQRRLQPAVLHWARANRVVEWEGSGRIGLSQADRLARCTHKPLGHLYLNEPPDDGLPIPDFRALEVRPRHCTP